jgi:polyphenol oxidase
MYESRERRRLAGQPSASPGAPGVGEGVPVALTSPLLERAGFCHAFFTREGGVSQPPWDSLNFAASTGDDPAAVRENLARAARLLGVLPERVYVLSQVHGTAYRVLSGDENWDDVVRSVGDITLSRSPEVAAGVRTADCVPVLVADRSSGAVAAIHSGWRGTVANVVRAGIAALRDLAGGSGDLCAAVGPHIERCCFEVGPDVADELARASSAGRAAVDEADRPRVDLRRIVRAQLEAEGLGSEAIDDVPGCTVCARSPSGTGAPYFHSFRRDGKRSGRLLSAIVALGA